MYKKLHIKKGHEAKLINGHPWVYSNEIANFAELKTLTNGSLVEINLVKEGAFALGYFNSHQLISARILTNNVAEKIDQDFFIRKIIAAKNLREKFFDKPFYRLIHSEADGLAGIVIDRFDNSFSCQITTAGMENLQHFLISALQEIFPNCAIIFKNDIESRKFEGLELVNKNICGEFSDSIIIEENELKFSIDLKNGQKTGWFFDQRINRNFISQISKDCDVLDAFCYQGGFGINALKGNAKSVTFIDSSKEALKKVAENIELNSFSNSKCEIINDKVFDALEKLARERRQFDVIILDPPAFVKSKKDLFSGLRGYEKLVRLAKPLLKKNAILFLASCSHNVSLPDFIDAANKGFNKNIRSNKSIKLIRCYGAGYDHPLHPALKESEYLKSVTFMLN